MTARSAILVQCANGTIHTAELGFFQLQSRAHRLHVVIGTQHMWPLAASGGWPLARGQLHSDSVNARRMRPYMPGGRWRGGPYNFLFFSFIYLL